MRLYSSVNSRFLRTICPTNRNVTRRVFSAQIGSLNACPQATQCVAPYLSISLTVKLQRDPSACSTYILNAAAIKEKASNSDFYIL